MHRGVVVGGGKNWQKHLGNSQPFNLRQMVSAILNSSSQEKYQMYGNICMLAFKFYGINHYLSLKTASLKLIYVGPIVYQKSRHDHQILYL